MMQIRMLRVIGALIGTTLGVSAGAAQSPVRILIPDKVTCKTCRIIVDSIGNIGDADPESDVSQVSMSVNSKGEFFVVELTTPYFIRAYDASGKILRTIGRRGNGPGEFINASAPYFVGDTAYVFDISALRLTVFSLEWKPVRVVRLPVGIIDVIVNGHRQLMALRQRYIAKDEAMRYSVALLSDSGSISKTFAEGIPTDAPAHWYSQLRFIGKADSGSIWSAFTNRYAVERWSASGELKMEVTRKPSWFRTWWTVSDLGPTRTRPQPELRSVWQDSSGLLWVVVVVPDDNWDDRDWEHTRPGSAEADSAYDTMVEVIDIRKGVLLASQRLPVYVHETFGEGYFYSRWDANDGSPRLSIRRLRLTRSQIK